MIARFFAALLVIVCAESFAGNTPPSSEPLQKIAFGSCAMQFLPQPNSFDDFTDLLLKV